GDAGGAGQTISFSFDGAAAGEAVTGEDGTASLPVTLSGAARTTEVVATFAGSDEYRESSAQSAFEVLKEDAALELTFDTSTAPVRGVARLTDSDSGAPLAGKSVSFTVNGVPFGTFTTGEDGTASIALPKPKNKGVQVTASFGGDESFNPASDQETLQKT
ncbi:MAG TPA: hypothetical protein VHJ76_05295, partial [Actinomycetota bacterium]|nr:hypothetical protein [Actinomycetota bacterium]